MYNAATEVTFEKTSHCRPFSLSFGQGCRIGARKSRCDQAHWLLETSVKAVYGGRPVKPNGQVQIKNVTDSQFMWFRHKESSSTVTDLGGGPYSVKGDTYLERLDYGLGSDFKL
jgi:hypothetical protein